MINRLSFVLISFLLLCPRTVWSNNLFEFQSRQSSVKVVRVVRCDLIEAEGDVFIRLIGLNAPDVPKVNNKLQRNEFGFVIEEKVEDPTISVEERGISYVRELLEGKVVLLEYDVNRRDDKWYTLAYVFLSDGTFVNAEIIRQGYARLSLQPPNLKYADELREAYHEARQEMRGLQGQ